MKTIYIDSDFKCHIINDGTMTAIETDVFDGKCDTFIEGYRFVPEGKIWTRSDGVVFKGTMISPFKNVQLLETAQFLYEENTKDKERITALEKDNVILKEENAMLLECILEMSEVIYA